jgi:predicted SAM-dependent methyltransferase
MITIFYKLMNTIRRPWLLHRYKSAHNLKIYYGCGKIRQSGYIGVDVRWTPAVDLLGDLRWCSRHFEGLCHEVFLSHVLEHYASPGKAMRYHQDTVIGALLDVMKLLKPSGVIRLAVPDFKVLAQIYIENNVALYPRLLGRICGEQDYPENLHRCVFDRDFLEMCLIRAGFECIEEWNPIMMGLNQDCSFDELPGVRTSLNLVAWKPKAPNSI